VSVLYTETVHQCVARERNTQTQ